MNKISKQTWALFEKNNSIMGALDRLRLNNYEKSWTERISNAKIKFADHLTPQTISLDLLGRNPMKVKNLDPDTVANKLIQARIGQYLAKRVELATKKINDSMGKMSSLFSKKELLDKDILHAIQNYKANGGKFDFRSLKFLPNQRSSESELNKIIEKIDQSENLLAKGKEYYAYGEDILNQVAQLPGFKNSADDLALTYNKFNGGLTSIIWDIKEPKSTKLPSTTTSLGSLDGVSNRPSISTMDISQQIESKLSDLTQKIYESIPEIDEITEERPDGTSLTQHFKARLNGRNFDEHSDIGEERPEGPQVTQDLKTKVNAMIRRNEGPEIDNPPVRPGYRK